MGDIPQVSYDMSDRTPQVENQREEGICFSILVADVVGTSYRIKYQTNLVLSPYSMIDQREKDDAMPILLDPERGFQERQSYPLRRTRSKYAAAQYNPDLPKYCIKDGYVARGKSPDY